jgi:hypothetical protein
MMPAILSRSSRALAAAGLAACTAAAGAACVRTRTDPVTGKVAVKVRAPGQKGQEWNARMSGVAPFTGAGGSARAEVLDGRTTVSFRVTGLTAGASHPWRVNEGRCNEPGAQVGDASLYAPILVSAQGAAEGTAQIPQALELTRRYKVRLFASPADSTSEVACGDLSNR